MNHGIKKRIGFAVASTAIAATVAAGIAGGQEEHARAAPAVLSLASCPGGSVSFPLAGGSIQWLYRDPDAIPKDKVLHTGIDVWAQSWNSAAGQDVGAPISGTFRRKSGSGVHIVNDSSSLDVYVTHVNFDSWVVDGAHVDRGSKIGTVNGDGHIHMSMNSKVGFNDLLQDDNVDPTPYLATTNLNVEKGATKSDKSLADWCASRPGVTPNPNAGYRGHWVDAPADGSNILTGPIHLKAVLDYMPKSVRRVEFTWWTPMIGPWSGPWKIACTDYVAAVPATYECDFYPPLGIPKGAEMNVSFDVYANDGSYTLSPGWIRKFYWWGTGYATSGGGTEPDHTPPSTPTFVSTPGTCIPQQNVTLQVTASDDQTPTGSLQFAFSADGSAFSDWSSNPTVSVSNLGHGDHVIDAKVRDLSNNESSPGRFAFSVDLRPPTIQVTQSGGMKGKREPWWVQGPVTTGAAADDEGCGESGLVLRFSPDGGATWSDYTTAVVASKEGKYNWAFLAIDGVGWSARQDVPTYLDFTKPVPGVSLSTEKITTDTETVVRAILRFTCDDTNRRDPTVIDVSGCYSTGYNLNSKYGPWTTYVNPIVLEELHLPKCTTFTKTYTAAPWMWSEDYAGNASSVMTAFVSSTLSVNTWLNCNSTPSPTPAPGCTISSGYTAVTLGGGSALTIPMTVKGQGGFAQQLTLSVSGLPFGVSGTLNPTSVIPTSTGVRTYLTLTTTASTPKGQSTTIAIRATAASGVTCVGYIKVST